MWKSKVLVLFLFISSLVAEISGYFKSHGFFFSFPYDKELIQLVRLRLKWEKEWSNFIFKIHYEINGMAGSQNYFSLLTGVYQEEFKPHYLHKSEESTIFHYLDRFSLTYNSQNFVLQLGRQRISWGKGRLFSPLDLFNPYNPFGLEKEERQGVDALKAQIYLSGFTWIEGVYASRREESNYGAALFTTLGNFDFTLAGAKELGGTKVFGIGMEGSLIGAGVRAELAVRNKEGKNFYDYSFGTDYQLTSRLYFLAEYFHADGAWIFPEGDVITLMADYQFTPLLRAQFSLFYTRPGGGRFFFLRLSYSAEENFDIVFGFLYSSSGESSWQLPKILYSGYSIFF